MSTLMFWNKQNGANQNGSDTKSGKRNWLHAPDVLVNGHVAYLVKFLGSCPVEQAKGIEVVKDAIRRLQFAQQMKKAEGGANVKAKKLEITVSIDGVAIQEPRTQTILHQFPLYKISYCADEKGVKKFFSFIAKTGAAANGDTTPTSEEGHECFVFISSKSASDITLTIGQAFDLAYRRYMNENGKFTEMGKLQQQNKQLERTVTLYRQRLKELAEILPKSDLDRLLIRLGLKDILEVPAQENGLDNHTTAMNGKKTPDLGIDVSAPCNDDQLLIETSPKHFAPIVPPRNLQNQINSTLEAFKPSVGTKLEGLLLNSDSDSDFDPRASESEMSNGNKITNDLFGFEPPKTLGQQLFASSNSNGTTLTNGLNGNAGVQAVTPPLLAPPPKTAAPRRSAPAQGLNTSSQDLFGSAPFNPHPVAFDLSEDSGVRRNPFGEQGGVLEAPQLATLANISSQFDDLLATSHAANPFGSFASDSLGPFEGASLSDKLLSATPKANDSKSKHLEFFNQIPSNGLNSTGDFKQGPSVWG
ncbi:PTB domain-containing adapter protein ced-6 isoform X2 [Phlebotomus papatasi]|uniref:PTB domain-containing adapter protein ced-6 isoform X2 n=1 Tax=Phlebotomus papatasi TaxID=29031 RepID=UPI00248350DA|nr:PTB domain-containing adapter protein ced-6 isoform X2 [Phlebotomus papatasi]XP_055703225.1 PTB domain-containing adapter protein ced-6 isoform X2 [Phlebotomus papatasi]